MREKKKKGELLEQYKIMVAARNFHYENFNKWLTYFYVANAAIFVGYIQVLSSDRLSDITHLELPILVLGFIAGLLFYWSSKGYYYWNINFINLVNHYEKNVLELPKKERIYSVFANKKLQNNYSSPISGANISSSKTAIFFAFIVALSWGSILVHMLLKDKTNCNDVWIVNLLSLGGSYIVIWLLSRLVAKEFFYSKIDHIPDLKIELD